MAYNTGRAWARAGRPLPADTPYERWGYWIRRGYYDPFDR